MKAQMKILTDSYRLHLQIHNPKNISFPNKKLHYQWTKKIGSIIIAVETPPIAACTLFPSCKAVRVEFIDGILS